MNSTAETRIVLVSSMYILCGAFRSNEEGSSCYLLDISHTTPPRQAEYYMDSSGHDLFIALIHTADIQL